MCERFTDSQMLKLVQIYRDYECLWNVTSDLYKNHDARKSAYRQIAKKLNISGISGKDIPNKIKNLRSSYYHELKKIEKNPMYKPKVSWFTTADGILKAFKNKEKIFSNVNEKLEIKIEELSNESNEFTSSTEFSSANEIIENQIQEQTETSLSAFTGPSNKRQDEIQEAIDKLDKIAANITKNTTSLLQNTEDEFDVFGRYIASTLRSLPSEFSIIAKTDIQKALSEIQLGALRQQSQSSMLPYSTSDQVKIYYSE